MSEGLAADTGEHVFSSFNESNVRTAVKVLSRYGAGYRAFEETDLVGPGYADLILVPPADEGASYLLELKYLKKSLDASKAAAAAQLAIDEARCQLARYSESPRVQEIRGLQKVAAVFHGTALICVKSL